MPTSVPRHSQRPRPQPETRPESRTRLPCVSASCGRTALASLGSANTPEACELCASVASLCGCGAVAAGLLLHHVVRGGGPRTAVPRRLVERTRPPRSDTLLAISSSAGAAHSADLPGRPWAALLRAADVAMYRVKSGEAAFPYPGTEADAAAAAVNGRRSGRAGTHLVAGSGSHPAQPRPTHAGDDGPCPTSDSSSPGRSIDVSSRRPASGAGRTACACSGPRARPPPAAAPCGRRAAVGASVSRPCRRTDRAGRSLRGCG
ncbi:hypothetical protein EHYA_04732 [Embleya hyalina]|uniref:Diguanylate cyclase n=1 Tax=Embleya hyalina TaxID=516124 RepID=A0A401YR59_9ACTN|nr:hypothetical protein EHYA_04732 [Embleya hyalina]